MTLFDKICNFLICNPCMPFILILGILSIMFIFKFWGCVALLILFWLIKRSNDQTA